MDGAAAERGAEAGGAGAKGAGRAASRAAGRLTRLGPEPLGPAFDGTALARRFEGKRRSVKEALLDQTLVAGIGNIYASEALFHARIAPERSAGSLKAGECAQLAAAVKSVLERAIAAGGSTRRDWRGSDGKAGWFQFAWAVYGREGEPCPGCDCRAQRGQSAKPQKGQGSSGGGKGAGRGRGGAKSPRGDPPLRPRRTGDLLLPEETGLGWLP